MDMKWRFPASNHGTEKGISSGDAEAFKKSPYSSFAREVLQNSIDAQKDKSKPVIVEFSTFEIGTDKIPGCEELKNAMKRCVSYWTHKKDYVKEYTEMLECINGDYIKCLRVSDKNTSGLIGVESNIHTNNRFLALCKGSGVSEKGDELTGGSKGVGKNASFLMSDIKTVIYSTQTCKSLEGVEGCYKGSIGVADFVSGYVDDCGELGSDYTQGTGFFGIDDNNNPSNNTFNLDDSYSERTEFGTDIYIIGFRQDDNWEKEVINSILDSFMVAIIRKQLVVKLNNIMIDDESVKDIIYSDQIVIKKNKANFISQYRILQGDPNVRIFDIETEYGSCELYVMPLSDKEEQYATHKCVMIRYPLMKIKDIDLGASFRVSAMCIIGDNPLGKQLLSIENPQHIDWEPKRIKDKTKQKEMNNVLREMRQNIVDCVMECLKLGEQEPIDPQGAGDFLPDLDLAGGEKKNNNSTTDEKVTVSKIKENITISTNSSEGLGEGLEPDIGEVDDEEKGDVSHPVGENDSDGGSSHPGDSSSGAKEGDDIIYKKTKLSGVRYNVISIDKNIGKIRVVFVAPIDYSECYIQIYLVDDAHNKTRININEICVRNEIINLCDEDGVGPFSISKNEKVVIDANVDKLGYFASEVKIICK